MSNQNHRGARLSLLLFVDPDRYTQFFFSTLLACFFFFLSLFSRLSSSSHYLPFFWIPVRS
jgi:hypothetical protein